MLSSVEHEISFITSVRMDFLKVKFSIEVLQEMNTRNTLEQSVAVGKLQSVSSPHIYGPCHLKTCLQGFVNIIDADQPAHLRSLISAFVVPILSSIICKLATGKILFVLLVSEADETGLKPVLSETSKTGFLMATPI